VEPHGAVAWRGLLDWLAMEPLDGGTAVLLETAHPAKFPEEVEKNLGFTPDVPPVMAAADKLPEDYDRMAADYGKFRQYLIERHAR
jgi:threonine synthase